MPTRARFVPKVSVLILLCTTWERSKLFDVYQRSGNDLGCMYILVQTGPVESDVVCVRSCFITSVMFAMQPWYCSQRIFTSMTNS
jgi:hypothetical protein